MNSDLANPTTEPDKERDQAIAAVLPCWGWCGLSGGVLGGGISWMAPWLFPSAWGVFSGCIPYSAPPFSLVAGALAGVCFGTQWGYQGEGDPDYPGRLTMPQKVSNVLLTLSVLALSILGGQCAAHMGWIGAAAAASPLGPGVYLGLVFFFLGCLVVETISNKGDINQRIEDSPGNHVALTSVKC